MFIVLVDGNLPNPVIFERNDETRLVINNTLYHNKSDDLLRSGFVSLHSPDYSLSFIEDEPDNIDKPDEDNSSPQLVCITPRLSDFMNCYCESGYSVTIFDVRMDEIIREKNVQKFNCALYFHFLF